MTVYFRSPRLVITDRLIRVRVPGGWQVWVLDGLTDFGISPSEASGARLNWGLGLSVIASILVAIRLRGWALLVPVAVLIVTATLSLTAGWLRRRKATSQLWAARRGRPVLVFELPDREFDAACRALRRVLDRREDEGHDR